MSENLENYDVVTGEKLPNGDISVPVRNFTKEIKFLVEKGTTEGLSKRDKARFMIVSESLVKAIEFYSKAWATELKKTEGLKEDFVDLSKSIWIQEGAKMTFIDGACAKEMKLEEIEKSASFSEKALKEIGREDLIVKYKVENGKKSPSLKIGALR
ncbi:MAG: hypothetical protein ACRCZB_05305 [Bacteroidales bacterium]